MRDDRVPAVASAGLAGLLMGPVVDGHVLAATRSAAYLALPPLSVVAVEAPGAVGLPCGVTLAGDADRLARILPGPDRLARILPGPDRLARILPGTPVSIGGGRLVVGHVGIRVTRWRDPRPRLAATTGPALRHRRARAAALVRAAPGAVDPGPAGARVLAGLDDLVAAAMDADLDRALAVADGLVGLGAGSTPSGDDVLAGLVAAGQVLSSATSPRSGPGAAWFARLGAAVAARAVDRTPALSAALLWHASRAEVARPAAALLHALAGTGELEPALAALLAVGHRSGHDLAHGILGAARVVAGTTSTSRAEVAHA